MYYKCDTRFNSSHFNNYLSVLIKYNYFYYVHSECRVSRKLLYTLIVSTTTLHLRAKLLENSAKLIIMATFLTVWTYLTR